jgi:hypothetical protein
MKTHFSSVQQLEAAITVIEEKFPNLSDAEKAEILKSCFKISASN